MKDIIKYMGLLVLIVFSFYYTDKISTIIIYESDLMKEIISHKNKEEKASTDAVISGNYITPGLNGLEINELDSYYQMKKGYTYSSSKLVFNEVEPDTSLEQNKHLVINKANIVKKAVAIIFANNSKVEEYCYSKGISASKLIKYKQFSKNSIFEQINNDIDMKKLDILLNKYKLNTNICMIDTANKKDCQVANKYLVKPTYYANNVTLVKTEVNSGDIIFIDDDLSLVNFKMLLKKISYRDLDIVFLSKLISEKRSDLDS